MFWVLQSAFCKGILFLFVMFTFLHPEMFQSWFKTDLIYESFDPMRKLRVENESLTKKIEKISLQRNICFIIIGSLFLGLVMMVWKNLNLRLRLTEFKKVTNNVATGTDGLEKPQVTVSTQIVAPECKICFNTYNNNKHPMHLNGCQSKSCKHSSSSEK